MNSIPPLSNGEVIYEGWLLKRGEHIKNWRQRYFVLFKVFSVRLHTIYNYNCILPFQSGSLLGFKNKPNDYSGDPLNGKNPYFKCKKFVEML